jgi:hypothetical protein
MGDEQPCGCRSQESGSGIQGSSLTSCGHELNFASSPALAPALVGERRREPCNFPIFSVER